MRSQHTDSSTMRLTRTLQRATIVPRDTLIEWTFKEGSKSTHFYSKDKNSRLR